MTSNNDTYNNEFGDHLKCICGHSYIAHFDKTEPHSATGCNYCICGEFVELLEIKDLES